MLFEQQTDHWLIVNNEYPARKTHALTRCVDFANG
jgi:hypothetical protein